jgi:hypothetical protein
MYGVRRKRVNEPVNIFHRQTLISTSITQQKVQAAILHPQVTENNKVERILSQKATTKYKNK